MAAADAARALEELVEISSQIEGAVLLAEDGSLLASTFADDGRSGRVAAAAAELLRAADATEARAARAPLGQLVVELPDGAVVCVRENGRAVAAVTVKEPTVGLVLYDLRTTLRLADTTKERPKRKPAARKKAAEKAEQPEGADA